MAGENGVEKPFGRERLLSSVKVMEIQSDQDPPSPFRSAELTAEALSPHRGERIKVRGEIDKFEVG
jgi:hypothetical protein